MRSILIARSIFYALALSSELVIDRVRPYWITDWLIAIVVTHIAASLGSEVELMIVASVSSAGVLIGIFDSPPGYFPTWLAIVNRLIVVALIWSSVWTQRQKRAAAREIKVLEGMLPICAHCKRIRVEDDVWQQLEFYISQHSEAEFTHTLCPNCIDKFR